MSTDLFYALNMDIYNELKIKMNDYWETLVLSIPKITIAVLVLCIFAFIAISVSRIIRKRWQKRAENVLVMNFIIRLLKSIIIIFGIILALNTLGFTNLAGGLLAGAGAGAIILGFAFKEIGENFLAGILLLFDRPFNIGDTVTIQGNMGKIVALNFRTTHLKAGNGADIFIPNAAIIKNELFNHTQDGMLRSDFLIGIEYSADIQTAQELIKKTINEHPEVINDNETLINIREFGPSVLLAIEFWTNTLDYKITASQTKMEVMRSVKNALMQNGYKLPAGYTEMKIRDSISVNNEPTI